METIKIAFFALGIFFGIETASVIAEKTIVTVDPVATTINIQLKNLTAVYPKEKGNASIDTEFAKIYHKKENWNVQLDSFSEKSIVYSSPEKGVLDATITLKYNKPEDLNIFAIDVNREGKYSLINIPQWNLKTTDGKQNGNYWNFEPNTTFTFSLAPLENIPATYTAEKELLYSIWEKISKR
ncbi:hypothetical protein [Kordia jejudonensis]|uniref:hypothetical protein n=1 Tax=Kordia jejudonensis TaxID=1348245 RepID=UPI0006298A01|nr:hypothetical protein [Kordia jejudonensis]